MANWIRNSRPIALLLKYFARAHIWVYRRTNGRIGAKLLRFPAALLTTSGRKSDEPRTTATLYLRDGEKVILPAPSVAATSIPCGTTTSRRIPRFGCKSLPSAWIWWPGTPQTLSANAIGPR